jgi:integrase
MYAYIVVSLLSGVRTEEARALRWDLVDLEAGTVSVWRSERIGGDTITPGSRRTLLLADTVTEALQAWKADQDQERCMAATRWSEQGLVFTTSTGGGLSAGNVRRWFKDVCERANLSRNWTPQELRHTFVSLLSENGMLIEEIADLVGHSSSHTTETVYRRQLRRVLRGGAVAMDAIFGNQESAGQQDDESSPLSPG